MSGSAKTPKKFPNILSYPNLTYSPVRNIVLQYKKSSDSNLQDAEA